MQLDEELFNTLHDDLEICRDYIRQVSLSMIKSGVSKYPIFVAVRSEGDVDLGLPIINRAEFDITWNFNASHLEDFVNKGLIQKDKAADFIKTYKDPAVYMCIFVADETSGSFAFMPYHRSKDNQG